MFFNFQRNNVEARIFYENFEKPRQVVRRIKNYETTKISTMESSTTNYSTAKNSTIKNWIRTNSLEGS